MEDFTEEQPLFFLSYANMRCRNESSSYENLLKTHSTDRFRVQGSLSNMEEFAKTWNCSDNSQMNPKKKYVLW
ncbi:Hypothetical predicted protein [Cloeon dipterum]|uniref:Peptidase M13 C-terminal domain-containing protein n=1 Tax=Cloeon dipterum TaxID=197152 RepID=A0A8S1DTI2_9INSE|nr:Hypothetical predicted protein [Cloeon dipterum]